MEPNTFTSENYNEMWCRHGYASYTHNIGSPVANRGASDKPRCFCVGKSCPALIIESTNTINDEKGWTGICGADHQYFIVKHHS